MRSVRNATSSSPSPSRHERRDARNPPAGADDHLATDLLAEDAVRGADVAAPLRRDRRRLQPEPVLADCRRGLVHNSVVGLLAPLEREVEPRELELHADHVGLEHTEAVLQELLPGLVALEHDDRPLVAHRARW